MPIDEVRININTRRDRIFLLMEELRRLRIQQRLKVTTHSVHSTQSVTQSVDLVLRCDLA
jgi:hypothetical protein